MPTSALSAEVHRLRKQAGLTQESLAAASGVTSITISRLERNVGIPEEDTLRKIAPPLGADPERLLALAEATRVGGRVKEHREFRQWSQIELADMASSNVPTIDAVERGFPAQVGVLGAIAKAFGYGTWGDFADSNRSTPVTQPSEHRPDTEGSVQMADGFLEQALMSLAPEVRGHARLKAMRAALEVVESFLPGAALTRDSGAQ